MYNSMNDFGRVVLGSGDLYAIEYEDFTNDMDVSDMVDVGYIQEDATFTREHETITITCANKGGKVDSFTGDYTTTFETGIISYNPDHVARFLTGAKVEKSEDGKTVTTYFAEQDKVPAIALVFVGIDDDTGNEFKLVMPRCKWTGDYELNFNTDDPIAMNYEFECLNSKLPSGDYGAAYIVETLATADSE